MGAYWGISPEQAARIHFAKSRCLSNEREKELKNSLKDINTELSKVDGRIDMLSHFFPDLKDYSDSEIVALKTHIRSTLNKINDMCEGFL